MPDVEFVNLFASIIVTHPQSFALPYAPFIPLKWMS
jgi:hypothetical protein